MNTLEARFVAAERAMLEHVAFIERCSNALEALGNDPPPAPRWNQDWFPRLDAAAAYAMVRRFQPRRIVEIGAGHSTRFLARATIDGSPETTLTTIDPSPRARLEGLPVELWRVPVQQVGDAPFASLQKNDFLFIDSSHKIHPGSDVERLVHGVLPALPPGVHVHFHDIFLPDEYPAGWRWRGYNEQCAVAELLERADYAIEFSSAWIRSRCADRIADGVLSRLPLLASAIESSLWMRKTGR